MADSLALWKLLQLRVFRLGGSENGNVGVGVFPQSEEIFVGGERSDASCVGFRSLRGLGLQSICARHPETRECSSPAVQDDSIVVANLLKLGSRGITQSRGQVCLSANIDMIEARVESENEMLPSSMGRAAFKALTAAAGSFLSNANRARIAGSQRD